MPIQFKETSLQIILQIKKRLHLSKPTLFCTYGNIESFSVLSVAQFLGIHLDVKLLKANSKHSIPLLQDNKRIIRDIPDICAHLCDKYAKDDCCLYPKNVSDRIKVNACLELHRLNSAVNCEQLTSEVNELDAKKTSHVNNLFYLLESLLTNNDFLCGSTLTIADICWVQSVMKRIKDSNLTFAQQFPKLVSWMRRIREQFPIQNRQLKMIGLTNKFI